MSAFIFRRLHVTQRARVARELWERIGPVSKEQVKIIAMKNGGKISAKDVENAVAIYGPHAGIAAGKATEPEPVPDRGGRMLAMPHQRVSIGLAMTTYIGNGKQFKAVKYLSGVIRGQIATMAGYNFIVERIRFDGEGAMEVLFIIIY